MQLVHVILKTALLLSSVIAFSLYRKTVTLSPWTLDLNELFFCIGTTAAYILMPLTFCFLYFFDMKISRLQEAAMGLSGVVLLGLNGIIVAIKYDDVKDQFWHDDFGKHTARACVTFTFISCCICILETAFAIFNAIRGS